MARTIVHRELRNNSSGILREVQAGETFTITDHGEPIAVLLPVAAASAIPLKRSTASGRFAEIEGVSSTRSSAAILDDLRGER